MNDMWLQQSSKRMRLETEPPPSSLDHSGTINFDEGCSSNRLKDFLLYHLDKETAPEELRWIDRENQIFQIIFYHGQREDIIINLWYNMKQRNGAEPKKYLFSSALKYLLRNHKIDELPQEKGKKFRIFCFSKNEPAKEAQRCVEHQPDLMNDGIKKINHSFEYFLNIYKKRHKDGSPEISVVKSRFKEMIGFLERLEPPNSPLHPPQGDSPMERPNSPVDPPPRRASAMEPPSSPVDSPQRASAMEPLSSPLELPQGASPMELPSSPLEPPQRASPTNVTSHIKNETLVPLEDSFGSYICNSADTESELDNINLEEDLTSPVYVDPDEYNMNFFNFLDCEPTYY